jgi:hypothetical protein
MQLPQNGTLVYNAVNYTVWQGQPGKTLSFQLAPATNTQGYRPGCLLALVSSGMYATMMVNYDPAGSLPGQTTCVGVLVDQDLTTTIPTATSTPATFKVATKNGAWYLINQFLYATATNLSDVPTGMAQLNGALYPQINSLVSFSPIEVWAI